ncbi:MAG: class I SAM-dependent rRNA methyltransferase [Paracoccaceae bacterium]|jgi:23S rRNA (cytosine1962-C5)-methyltransferase|nr:class I SAM-dependent rRNA methyltransferase [Paracoccaceae bacterium]
MDPAPDTPSDTDAADRSVIRLRPKANARAIRHGFPWVYADELVLDRRTKALAPGTIARLEDAERRPLGTAALTPASRIPARLLDRDPEAVIDRAWLTERIGRALALRERLYPTPFYRLVHAEADRLPGLVIDRFGTAAAIQPNAAWADRLLPEIVAALIEVTGARTVVKNGQGRARAAEGLPEDTVVLQGAADAPVAVAMNGATYMADLTGGQKTGLYYDQRDNHAFAARLVAGRADARVLDVFSHVGGFSLAALAAGAGHALAVDGSEPALALARRGAEATGVADRFETRRQDAFAALDALGGEGARFDLVVCDPPAFVPSKQALEQGLRAYERVARLAAPLVAPGGFLVLCSCSHAADLARFRTSCGRGIGRAGRRGQLIQTGFAGPDHPSLPELGETAYLKALTFRLDG